jgi:hypothetical protein
MKWLCSLLLLIAPLTSLSAQQINIGRRTTPDIALRLVGPFQSVRVTGWKSDSVSLSGYVGAEYRLDNVFSGDPGAPSAGAKLYIEGPTVGTTKSALLELRVPVGARVWIKGGTGSVVVTGVTGEVDVNMIGGSVTVSGNPRTLNVEAMDADVTVDGQPEWVRLKTAAGDISMRGGSADAAMTTISGVMRVGDGVYERARFESVSGNLYFDGDLVRGASVTFDSHGGIIDLQLGAKTSPGFTVDAATLAGRIENLLSKDTPKSGRDGRGQELNFEVGIGSGRIVVRTYKGDIRLARR